jgi:hypothetical protein
VTRVFDYYEAGRWPMGIPVEDSCRRWVWADYHGTDRRLAAGVLRAVTDVHPAAPGGDMVITVTADLDHEVGPQGSGWPN